MGNQPERPGFDRVASFIGQGNFDNCEILVDGARTRTKGWVDDVTTDYALDFLAKNKDKPLAMVVGFKSPHGPRTPPARLADAYAGEEMAPASNAKPRAVYLPVADGPATVPAAPAKAKFSDDKRNYMRCVTAVDENVGRILTALDEHGLARDTVVVFVGDNGYYFGEHGLGDKRSAYEESLRIPLLLRYPGGVAPGRTMDETVLNLDLAPTFLELGGVKVLPEMHGRSWAPLLGGTADGWRDCFLYEYWQERQYPNTPTIAAVRTNTHKLITYPGHDEWT
jgi:arylsulfatase A-like enzyme